MGALRLQLPRQELLALTGAFRSITSRSGHGIYASSDRLFKGAVFGRDSLEVAEDLMEVRPRMVRNILLTLASLQGVQFSDISEEDPGKILHEYRRLDMDGRPLDDVSRFIFDQLAQKWGREGNAMIYFGSIDATPHYIRVVGAFARRYGRQMLKERVMQRDGNRVSLLASVALATDWLIKKLDASSSGLLEYRRRNPFGIENQVWKDSREFYVHEDGQLANFNRPIASIEVQGLAYDALMAASDILSERAADLELRARSLQARTIELLWQPARHYFALGLDHDENERLRCISTITANPASLLDTAFFDSLPIESRRQYIGGIVRMIMSQEFLTDAGIRSRALSEAKLISFWDYHGSYTSWPKETYDVAKGLRRQGFGQLSQELENRLLNVVKKSRGYPEFIYVDGRGRVLAGAPGGHAHGHHMMVNSTNRPETVQAWTLSAVTAIIYSRLSGQKPVRTPMDAWQQEVEQEVLAHVPHVGRLRWRKELSARYPDYSYELHQQSNDGA